MRSGRQVGQNRRSGAHVGAAALLLSAFVAGTGVVGARSAEAVSKVRVVPVASVALLAKALAAAKPGDRIELADGIYSLSSTLRISASGTATAPIVIAAKRGARAEIKGSRTFDIDGSYLTFDGLTFRNEQTFKIPADEHHIRLTRNTFTLASSVANWVAVAGDDVEVDHNRFTGKSTAGVFMHIAGPGEQHMAKRTHVHHNYFSDHTFPGSSGGEALRLGLSSRQHGSAHTLVEDNLFERVNGDPEAISVKSSDNVIRRNTIRDSTGTITLRHGRRNVVDSNLLMGGQTGIRVFGNDHVIINNVVQDSTRSPLLDIGGGDVQDDTNSSVVHAAADRVLVAFNTLRSASSIAVEIGDDRDRFHPTEITLANNILIGRRSARVETGRQLVWTGNLGSGSTVGVPAGGFRTADTKLVKDAFSVYRPATGSAAIRAALGTFASVTVDLDGQRRPTYKRTVGADEPNKPPLAASL
jgi:poly(beta-D-mannuronate) lyase